MNFLFLLVLLFGVYKVCDGYRKGMVKEIISFISMIVLCLVILLISNALQSYLHHEILGLIIAVALLAVLGIVHHLLGIVFFSAKLISKLPILHSVDKLLGIVVGLLEAVLILWTVYALVIYFSLGMIGELILTYTAQNKFLTFCYERNMLIPLVNSLMGKIAP